ncbi:4'-phosphopantetheinyl transferase family protein [Streptomyces lavendulae]|uniref:4'-phosphopantetheinyl transferase family protein n=1 Tax=Streptomyces lavendulae TaxID=1914 RepID=UPI0036A05390
MPFTVQGSDLSHLDAEGRARSRPSSTPPTATAHPTLRRVLSAYRGVTPAEPRFARRACPCCGGPHGRPVPAGSGTPHFSMSHTGGLVLIAVAGRPVGVDVERLPVPHKATTVGEVLHPAERREVHAAPPSLRPAVFARLWARKEAYLKGLGTGVGRGPDLDHLGDPAPGAPARPPGSSGRERAVGQSGTAQPGGGQASSWEDCTGRSGLSASADGCSGTIAQGIKKELMAGYRSVPAVRGRTDPAASSGSREFGRAERPK